MGHTPGPWRARPYDGQVVMNGVTCCMQLDIPAVFSGRCGYNPDDIRLMAAAPDLLAACEELLIYLGDWDDMDNDTCAAAKKAIAKAKGAPAWDASMAGPTSE